MTTFNFSLFLPICFNLDRSLIYGSKLTNPRFAQQPRDGPPNRHSRAICHTILHIILRRWLFSIKIGAVKGFENDRPISFICVSPGEDMISAVLGGRRWASLIEYHVCNSWVLGAHHWRCVSGDSRSNRVQEPGPRSRLYLRTLRLSRPTRTVTRWWRTRIAARDFTGITNARLCDYCHKITSYRRLEEVRPVNRVTGFRVDQWEGGDKFSRI
jgi:hypothetical protein